MFNLHIIIIILKISLEKNELLKGWERLQFYMQLHSKAYRISILDCMFKEPKAYCNAFEHIITMFFFRFVPAGCVQARLAYVEAQGELKVPFKDALPTREEQLSSLRNTEEFDILVVGGGATGSGCALDAVTRSMCFFLTKFCNITLLI